MIKLEIKICGNTEEQNLQEVCKLQPDYVGFIFYEKSKRFVSNSKLVAKKKDCKAKRVGVFVNASIEYITQIIRDFELDIIQLHGDEPPEFCQKVSKLRPVFKAFLINNIFNFNMLNDYKSVCHKFLFDTNSNSYGGSGKKFDWQLLQAYKLNIPFILSGGIGPNDIENIKLLAHPMLSGIDLNSKFELTPGVKNMETLSTFINQFRL